jgi:hypothetical protein
VTLRTFTVSVQAVLPPASGFIRETGFDISGTLANGQSVTITDTQSRFGTKTGSGKPWAYFPMTGGTAYDSTYSRATSAITITNGDFYTGETSPSGGTGCTRIHHLSASGPTGTTGAWGVSGITNGFAYVFTHRRYMWPVLTDGVATNLKSFRLRSTGGTASTQIDFFLLLQSASYPTGVVDEVAVPQRPSVGSQVCSTNLGGGGARSQIGMNWHRFEYDLVPSSYGGTDGKIIPWINGARPTSAGGSQGPLYANGTDGFMTRGNGSVDELPTYMSFDQISNNSGATAEDYANSYTLYGPTLVDDSRCRVIVSDEATWNTTSSVFPVRDFCVPTLWSANSITLLLRKGVHSALSGKYLWVVTSDGTALKIGRFT